MIGAGTLSAVADRLRAHPFALWFYGDSIGFEGLLAADALTGRTGFRDFAHGVFRGWAARRRPFRADDNTAPGRAMCHLAAETGDEVLREALDDLAVHLFARRRVEGAAITFEDTLRALRPPYGGEALAAADARLMEDPGAGVWLDCLHFDPPFYAALEALFPGRGWGAAAEAEALAYRDMLRDPETGLYRHFWLEKTGKSYIRGWGRGQGWALLGLLDVAESLPRAATGEVGAAVRDLAGAMRARQRADGNWWALVHEPRSGEESSTAAFMACAFYRGMSLGLLPAEQFAEPAERAWNAMAANLGADGVLTGVSAAVYAALVESHYWHVTVGHVVPWGQGPVLTAAAARAAWQKEAA